MEKDALKIIFRAIIIRIAILLFPTLLSRCIPKKHLGKWLRSMRQQGPFSVPLGRSTTFLLV